MRDENVALTLQVDKLAQELARKDLPLQKNAASQRPHHPSQLSSITMSGQEDWRGQCEGLADLIVKFLHSMRRLQKVVHKKESNVQKEK